MTQKSRTRKGRDPGPSKPPDVVIEAPGGVRVLQEEGTKRNRNGHGSRATIRMGPYLRIKDYTMSVMIVG